MDKFDGMRRKLYKKPFLCFACFWQKEIGWKFAPKMLAKSRKGVTQNMNFHIFVILWMNKKAFTVYNCKFAPKFLRFWFPLILLQSFKPTGWPSLFCLLHSLAAPVSSQPTSCFVHEQPFSVANAGQPTSFQLELCTLQLGELPVKICHWVL